MARPAARDSPPKAPRRPHVALLVALSLGAGLWLGARASSGHTHPLQASAPRESKSRARATLADTPLPTPAVTILQYDTRMGTAPSVPLTQYFHKSALLWFWYCRRHGYRYRLYTGMQDPPVAGANWYKLAALRAEVSAGAPGSRVLLVDTDTLPVEPDLPLLAYLDVLEAEGRVVNSTLVVTRMQDVANPNRQEHVLGHWGDRDYLVHYHSGSDTFLNGGMILVRKDDFAEQMVMQVLTSICDDLCSYANRWKAKPQQGIWAEQACWEEMLKKRGYTEDPARLSRLPYQDLNSPWGRYILHLTSARPNLRATEFDYMQARAGMRQGTIKALLDAMYAEGAPYVNRSALDLRPEMGGCQDEDNFAYKAAKAQLEGLKAGAGGLKMLQAELAGQDLASTLAIRPHR